MRTSSAILLLLPCVLCRRNSYQEPEQFSRSGARRVQQQQQQQQRQQLNYQQHHYRRTTKRSPAPLRVQPPKYPPLLTSKYVAYEADGTPYVNCTYKEFGKPDVPVVKQCKIPETSRIWDMGIACYAIFDPNNGQIFGQDCWTMQEFALRGQCSHKACRADRPQDGASSKPFGFCCCFGHNCNAEPTV